MKKVLLALCVGLMFCGFAACKRIDNDNADKTGAAVTELSIV
jgi:hypothetical protein